MHLLSAALLERQQTHSEKVNEKGVARGSRTESNVYPCTCRNFTDMT